MMCWCRFIGDPRRMTRLACGWVSEEEKRSRSSVTGVTARGAGQV